MRYVEAGSCRHDFILRYFGDEGELLGGCGHCDVCERLEEAGGAPATATADADPATVVRQALSAVARAKGRVGVNAVAEMLAGGTGEQQRRLGFVRLSTHGLLRDRPRPWIQALVRRLVTAGLVDITADEYPLVQLTERGAAVMTGRAPVEVLLPTERPPRVPRGAARRRATVTETLARSLTATEVELFEELRETRRRLAAERGCPPYVVCHDRTLLEIAARRPSTDAELATIHGMGPARLAVYGHTFLAVVGRHES
jgi:ATP-dependent DNA helicase RecQ